MIAQKPTWNEQLAGWIGSLLLNGAILSSHISTYLIGQLSSNAQPTAPGRRRVHTPYRLCQGVVG